MKSKTALIARITGQDGSNLAELLLDKGYEVHGIIRRTSTFNTRRPAEVDAMIGNPSRAQALLGAGPGRG